MTSIVDTIAPKSDQLNSDDLIAGPRTIRVTKVSLLGEEQPVAIHYEGDGGKPFKPCKSMRRVMVAIWGPDANAYVGRSMTLYRDPNVQFGGQAVGGIRISHMSDIERDHTMALTASRANRKPFTVKPLRDAATKSTPRPQSGAVAGDAGQGTTQGPPADKAAPGLPERVARAVAALNGCPDAGAVEAAWSKMAALQADAVGTPEERILADARANKLASFQTQEPAPELSDAPVY